MTIARQLREKKNKTVYQQIAEAHGVTVDFVGKIARQERQPRRGKGLKVKQSLESLIKQR